MHSKWTLTRAGMVFVGLLVAGILALVFGGHIIQIIGLLVTALAVGALAFDQLPNRVSALLTVNEVRGRTTPGGLSSLTPADPAPEYIPEAPEAPDTAWEREREHYREKDETGEPS